MNTRSTTAAQDNVQPSTQSTHIRIRLWVATALPALLVLVVLLFGFFERHNRELTEALTDRAQAAAKQLAGAVEFPLFAADMDTLQRLAESTLNGDSALLRVVVIPAGRTTKAIAGKRTLPLPMMGRHLDIQQHPHHISVSAPVFLNSFAKPDLLDMGPDPKQDNRGQLVGHVLLDFSLSSLEQRRHDLMWWSLVTTGLALLLAGWLSLRISSSVTQPIAKIAQVVESIGAGDSQARVDSTLTGPLRPLALGINDMAARVEVTQEQLKQQVEVATGKLREAFEKLRESDRQHIIASERQRLIRDIHDGVGSQLVQTLNLMRNAQCTANLPTLEKMVQYALEELRMTLNSLEPMEGDLPAILGTLRYRLTPALEAAGVELVWEVDDVPAVNSLDAQGVLNLFRCLQELFANVVQHAQASKVVVRTWAEGQQVHLSVEDNGCGLKAVPSSAVGGRGLQNILARTQAMGAKVRFYDAQPGTGVAFEFSAVTTSP